MQHDGDIIGRAEVKGTAECCLPVSVEGSGITCSVDFNTSEVNLVQVICTIAAADRYIGRLSRNRYHIVAGIAPSVGNIDAVMDGDIDGFLDEYLSAKWKGLPTDSSGDSGDDM